MHAEVLDQLSQLGFNSDVRHADTTFHVQTEVVGRKSPHIRSMVLVGGRVVFTEEHHCPYDGDVDTLRKIVDAYHKQIVERITRDGIGFR